MGSPMMSWTFMRGLSEPYGSWKTICISERSGLTSFSGRCAMSLPSKMISPSSGAMRRLMRRLVVDLPQPDSPTSEKVSPG